jgi:glycosyltransferase involved in cell wall biosynthesis
LKPEEAPGLPALFVFCASRWDLAFRRPQQLMTRLARHWRVFFVEPPLDCEAGTPRLELRPRGETLEVLVPHLLRPAAGFEDARLAPLLAAFVKQRGLGRTVAWLGTPLALPLAEALKPACLVYDCTEGPELDDGSVRRWRRREAALLRRAALVLTGGPSLYEACRPRHANVHDLPSAVESAEFAPERLDLRTLAAEAAWQAQQDLPAPRLGSFGVIDRHVDLALLARLADARRDWQIVMAGPLDGVSPKDLPQRPNLHWLGAQPRERLPHLLAGWEVALLPLRTDAAARWLSPGETLEYMAGGKPVVATAVPDVVALYGSVVEIATGARAFVQACEQVLSESRDRRCVRALDMLTTVSTQSWQRTADVVHRLLLQALPRAEPAAVVAAPVLPAALAA